MQAGRQADTLGFGKAPMTMLLVSPQNVMFYDMGSGSTVCTIVTYQTVKTKEAGMQPQLQIRGVG
jgi:hypoxia up-regulated 1